ncbi:hypothetical protein [Enterococcus larvae]|uniref:hypothetical protein n=1 Tax=Enterococcus larvae TaxID=2794352 RepID=UPI003F3C2143
MKKLEEAKEATLSKVALYSATSALLKDLLCVKATSFFNKQKESFFPFAKNAREKDIGPQE